MDNSGLNDFVEHHKIEKDETRKTEIKLVILNKEKIGKTSRHPILPNLRNVS
jgi:hypothetical protein